MADFYLDYRGSDYNGGGYDSTITGATVNLASGQYAALTASGLECTAGSTTVTSVYGGFTSDMIGNALNIYRGDNYTWGIYYISGVPNSTTIFLDRTPASSSNGVSGVAKVGGAWRTEANLKRDSAGWGWFFYNVVSASDTIHVRGNGQDNPPSGQYYGIPYNRLCQGGNGNPILMKGYNGRPAWEIQRGNLFFYQVGNCVFDHMKFFGSAGDWATNHRCISQGRSGINDCIYDQLGSRGGAFEGMVKNCYVYNSDYDGTDKTGSANIAISTVDHGMEASYNVVENFVGDGIRTTNINGCHHNIIDHVSRTGIMVSNGSNTNYIQNIKFNTINNCGGAGIRMTYSYNINVFGNLITNCSGEPIYSVNNYINYLEDVKTFDYNAYYNNGNAFYNAVSGNNDIQLTQDPYTNATSGDFTLNNTEGGGKSLRGAIQMNTAGYAKSETYQDIGALQAYDK